MILPTIQQCLSQKLKQALRQLNNGVDYILQMQIEIDIGKIAFQFAIYAFIALFIGISQAAGIGGGPILNICLMLGLGYEAKTSMAITYIFLIGGSLASVYSNYGKKSQDGSKNIIDYNLIMITLPMTVSGSIFGALFNHFISEFIISIAFTALLSYLAVNSYKKYVDCSKPPLRQPLLLQPAIQMEDMSEQNRNSKLQAILQDQLNPFPKQKLILFLQIIAYTIILLLFKGGSNYQSVIGLEQCGFGTWVCVFIHVGLSYYYGKSIAMKQYSLDAVKQSLGYVFKNESDQMSEKYLKKAMFLGFAGGFTGGALGIGGAIILVPAWMEMGIDKTVAASSSAPLIFSSAFISMLIAYLCNFYDSLIQVVLYFVLAFIASFYIKSAINWIKQKYRLQGMIFLLLIFVMVMSLVFLLPYSVRKLMTNPTDFFAFGHMC